MTARGTMTIGQVGLDPGCPLTVPSSGRWTGDTLTLSGTLGDQGTKTQGRVLRAQFQGLADRVGDVLPVTFGDSPELDGWYEIGRPSISTDGASFESGVFDLSIDLTRVSRSANVLQEMRLLGAGRTNSHTFTTVRRGWYSPGVNAYAIDDGTYSVNAPTRNPRTGADGAMLVVVDNASGVSLFDATARWRVAADDYYDGGCTILRAVEGTYYRVVGEQIPAGYEGTWAMGNSLLSILGSTTAGKVEWSMLWHDGANYESFKTFRITNDSSWTEHGYGPVGMQIIRNNVDVAAIRVFYGAINTANQFWLDISVRRGARHAEFRWHGQDTVAGSLAWGVKLTSAEAGTNHTSGIHATSADAAGNKYILTSPSTVTTDTTNGRMRLSSNSTDFRFMVGAEMAGAGANFDDFTAIVYQYMGAVSTRQRAVLG